MRQSTAHFFRAVVALMSMLILFGWYLVSAAESPELTVNERIDRKWEEMLSIYGDNSMRWPLSAKAEYQQFVLELRGQPVDPSYIHGMPTASDLTVDEAIAIATNALQNGFGLTDDVISRLYPCISFNVANPWLPEYDIWFEPIHLEDAMVIGQYQVRLAGATGEILYLWSWKEGGEW